MLLYATTTSERASKGQGGNEFLKIEIKNDKQEILAVISLEPKQNSDEFQTIRIDYDRYTTGIKRIMWDDWNKEAKGNKQKGDRRDCAYTSTDGAYCTTHNTTH